MPRERSDNQAVDAFSAPKDLLVAAHREARKRRMSKSGFYRYCLAKEVGLSEREALRIAENPSIDAPRVMQSVGDNNSGPVSMRISYSKPKRKRK